MQDVYKFKGVSSTRRHNFSGRRIKEVYFWDVSIAKHHLVHIGWWSSRLENVRFQTIPSETNKFCDLKRFPEDITPMPQGIHKFKVQQGNRIRFAPYFGRGLWWEPLPDADYDTRLEYHPLEDILRLFYISGLRPYQHDAFTIPSTRIAAMKRDQDYGQR